MNAFHGLGMATSGLPNPLVTRLVGDLNRIVPALAGVGAGIGIVFGSLIHSVSRNPSLSKQLFGYAILGFALSEAMALFALMVAFFILFSDGHHASLFLFVLPLAMPSLMGTMHPPWERGCPLFLLSL